MQYYFIPVIIVSTITINDPYSVVKILELGTFDIIKTSICILLNKYSKEVLFKIHITYCR